MNQGRPTHRLKSDGSLVFPEGHKKSDIKVLPPDFWEAEDLRAATDAMRAERDRRLHETDKLMGIDRLRAMSPAGRKALFAHRQALRDMPATADPLKPLWPNLGN
jgi:hypothetical protein